MYGELNDPGRRAQPHTPAARPQSLTPDADGRAEEPDPPGPPGADRPAAERVAIAIVTRGDSILVGLRSRPPLAGYAEFPGGRALSGESPDAAAIREVREEAGLEVRVEALLSRSAWAYPHATVDLYFFACRPTIASPPRPHAPFDWVPIDSLRGLCFPPANAPVLEKIIRPIG